MARVLRGLLGIPKPKESDDLAPDDPPWPDVRVVVIVNKRSGGRTVGKHLRAFLPLLLSTRRQPTPPVSCGVLGFRVQGLVF